MIKTLLISLFIGTISLFSCTKDDDCIDKSKVKEGAMCPQNYDPVCGCNNVTYGNSCEANAAGVKSFTIGACK